MKKNLFFMNRPGLAAIGLALSLNCGVSLADVVAVVSVRSPVTTLSKEQIADIFLSKTTRFPDGEQVLPIDQAEGSAARNEFYLKYAAKSASQIKAYWSKLLFTGRGRPPKTVLDDSEVMKRISENPNAIGYIHRGMADRSVRVLTGD